MTDRTGLVYVENDIELLGPIGPGAIYDESRKDNDVIDIPCAVYKENETELSWSTKPSMVYHENQTA